MNRITIGAMALALPLLTSVAPAIAQSTVYTTINAQSGKPVRLGVYAGLNKDCSQGPLPEIKVTQNPTHGVFVIRKAKASVRGEGRCPAGTEAEVQVVFYQSRANYIGDDGVSYEVRSGDQVRSYSIALSIKASAPARKRPDTTDL
jgi:hypothetical protein